MADFELAEIEEPNVTPLIDVNLVLIIIALLLASHSAKLLPFIIPKTEKKTEFLEMKDAIPLSVQKGETFQLGGKSGMSGIQLKGELDKLKDGSVLLVSMDPEAHYDTLVQAVDNVMSRPSLRVAFSQTGIKGTTAPAAPAAAAPAATK